MVGEVEYIGDGPDEFGGREEYFKAKLRQDFNK
jgi:hypothetical protein